MTVLFLDWTEATYENALQSRQATSPLDPEKYLRLVTGLDKC